jgi:hypothetical protein
MPLKDRDKKGRRRLVRLGVIRLGHKETSARSGKEYPVQDDHFVFTDAPELAEFYGDDCREIDVMLPFPDIWRNFDAYYTVWAGGVLICKGDGEQVQYAAPFEVKRNNGRVHVYNAEGDTLVSDGVAQVAFAWNGENFAPGDTVPCPGAAQGAYTHCRACRESAILKVMMADPALFRLGYYQVATGSRRNYDTIMNTLELVSANGARPLNGFPFKLRLVEEPTTYVEDGKRHATTKWFLQLEPDPTLTRKLYQLQAARLLAEPEEPLALTTGEVEGEFEEYDEVEDEATPPFAEDGGPAEEPEEDAGLAVPDDLPDTWPDFANHPAVRELGYTGPTHVLAAYRKIQGDKGAAISHGGSKKLLESPEVLFALLVDYKAAHAAQQ